MTENIFKFKNGKFYITEGYGSVKKIREEEPPESATTPEAEPPESAPAPEAESSEFPLGFSGSEEQLKKTALGIAYLSGVKNMEELTALKTAVKNWSESNSIRLEEAILGNPETVFRAAGEDVEDGLMYINPDGFGKTDGEEGGSGEVDGETSSGTSGSTTPPASGSAAPASGSAAPASGGGRGRPEIGDDDYEPMEMGESKYFYPRQAKKVVRHHSLIPWKVR